MKSRCALLAIVLLSLTVVVRTRGQSDKPKNPPEAQKNPAETAKNPPEAQRNPATVPPKLLVLVHQEFKFGKESARDKLSAAISRACDHLAVPNSWIDLQSITGPPEALSFDPFDSFEQTGAAFLAWGQLFASHPELGRMQEELRALESSEHTIIAVRRDDLGYRKDRIDLSKARFMRVLEVRLRPGHESNFVDAFKVLGAAYEKIDADMPWVVYQANVGMPSPSFLVFVPMRALKENDALLARSSKLREAEGEEGFQRMQQIARDAYASTESNLYAVSPATSHVSKEFAAGNPEFWSPKPAASPAQPKVINPLREPGRRSNPAKQEKQ